MDGAHVFNLLREDIFPIGDLGVRRAMERLYFDGASPSPSVLVDLAEPWRPYRSVASLYLWKSID